MLSDIFIIGLILAIFCALAVPVRTILMSGGLYFKDGDLVEISSGDGLPKGIERGQIYTVRVDDSALFEKPQERIIII
jgi:hypothetical protein